MTARVSFVAICAIVLGLVGCNRRAFTVPGESMEHTFRRGDKVIADMWAYALHAPRRWDVVVVHPKTDELKDVVWVMRRRTAGRGDLLFRRTHSYRRHTIGAASAGSVCIAHNK